MTISETRFGGNAPGLPALSPPAPLPGLPSAFSRRRAIFGAHDLREDREMEAPLAKPRVGPVYTPESPPPFDEWPAVYGLRCFGNCCEPEIADGSSVIIDQQAPHGAGDFVVIWSLGTNGEITAFVKRLVTCLPPGMRLPYRRDPRSELHPVLFVEKLNPPRQFEVDLAKVYAVHRCVGVAPPRPDVAVGTTVDYSDIRLFDRPGLTGRQRRNLRAVGGRIA